MKQGTPMFGQGGGGGMPGGMPGMPGMPGGMPSMPGMGGAPASTGGTVTHLSDITEMQVQMATCPGMIIDFWSPQCPPCVKFKPEFEQLASFYSSD